MRVTAMGLRPAGVKYPGFNKFSDEGGKAIDGNLLNFMMNDLARDQFDYFMMSTSRGLPQVGMGRLNQSIEAFVYCVLWAQVNVRSSILWPAGSAKEAQSEFLTLMKDAIRQTDISKSVQRFQLAVDEANVRLDLAISPGTWLMPSDLEINTESTVGHNNNLNASANMKLEVNSSVNQDMKRVGVRLMDGGGSRNKRPRGHPSNPIHRPSETQGSTDSEKQSSNGREKQSSRQLPQQALQSSGNGETSHETLKTDVFILSAVSAFLIYNLK